MDRKAWIVLITCGILLAVNMHYAGKNAEATRILEESKKQEEALAKKPADEPIGELTVKPEPIPEYIAISSSPPPTISPFHPSKAASNGQNSVKRRQSTAVATFS
jgi:hypothetical protein